MKHRQILEATVASDLLEALRALLDMVTDNRLHGPEILKACDAIAKAEERGPE
jgi:hypothetical protein